MTLRKFTTSMIITGFLLCGGAVQAASYQFGQLLAGNGPTNPYFADLEITIMVVEIGHLLSPL